MNQSEATEHVANLLYADDVFDDVLIYTPTEPAPLKIVARSGDTHMWVTVEILAAPHE